MSTPFAIADRKNLAILLATLLLTLTGCANADLHMRRGLVPRAEIVLRQPFAPPSQQQLNLASAWAFESTADNRRRWLLAFPLPSTPDGPRDFQLYVSTPDGLGAFTVNQNSPDAARGFLIQEVGKLRGKSDITGGQVRVSKAWFDWRKYALDLNLTCADGATIIGQAVADPLSTELSRFERRYSGDVLALTPQNGAEDLASDNSVGQTDASPESQPRADN